MQLSCARYIHQREILSQEYLQESSEAKIYTKVSQDANATIGSVYTNKEYAPYVEFGTGPVGASNHQGISPNVAVTYTQKGWVWPDVDGGFHATEGQPAQPFMYPALKTMESHVIKAIAADLQAGIRKAGGT